MIILSHRGFWKKPVEKNQRIAFRRSFDAGFGTETDLRDAGGQIVISHDLPKGGEMPFDEFLQIMDGRNLPLALNIKADGLADLIKDTLAKYSHTNYFTFDMSIPEFVAQSRLGLKFITEYSEFAPMPIMLEQSIGVWLNAWKGHWYDAATIDLLIEQEKKVVICSDDLHHRDTENQWNTIRQSRYRESNNLMLCTDTPDKAKGFFQ
jgi:hypothetical protein